MPEYAIEVVSAFCKAEIQAASFTGVLGSNPSLIDNSTIVTVRTYVHMRY